MSILLFVIIFISIFIFNCLSCYILSSCILKLYIKKQIERSKKYLYFIDNYILSSLIYLTCFSYCLISFLLIKRIYSPSDFLLPLALLLGFILSSFTISISRISYCYACNFILGTKLRKRHCLKINFLYIFSLMYPLFVLSFIISLSYMLDLKNNYRLVVSILGISLYLVIQALNKPYFQFIYLNASLINDKRVFVALNNLFKKHGIKNAKLYKYDSSLTNEVNCMVVYNGFYYIYISTSMLDELNQKELIACLLHEIGHIKNKHLFNSFIFKLVSLLLIGLELAVCLIYLNDTILAIILTSILLIIISIISYVYSRKNEVQADEYVAMHNYGDSLINVLNKFEVNNDSKIEKKLSIYSNLDDRVNNIRRSKNGKNN